MAKPASKLKIWLSLIGLLLGLVAFISFRVSYLERHGQSVFWLAELFSPVAVFSVLLVTFVDKLVAPPSKASTRAPKKARR